MRQKIWTQYRYVFICGVFKKKKCNRRFELYDALSYILYIYVASSGDEMSFPIDTF